MLLSQQVATQAVVKGLFNINGGNLGPEPTQASVDAIANTPELGDLTGATDQDIINVSGLALRDFTADDCDAINSQWDELWQFIMDLLRRYWDKVHASDPQFGAFPTRRFLKPDPDCDVAVVQYTSLLSIDWGN